MSIIITLVDAKDSAELTPDEVQLLRDYRSLHDDAKKLAQSYMYHYSVSCPRKAPVLQLLKGSVE